MRQDKIDLDESKDKIIETCRQKVISPVGLKRRLSTEAEGKNSNQRQLARKKIDERLCFFCGRRLKFFNTYNCRCGYNFCVKHRFYDQHSCSFDYKTEAKAVLKSSNPKITAKKIER